MGETSQIKPLHISNYRRTASPRSTVGSSTIWMWLICKYDFTVYRGGGGFRASQNLWKWRKSVTFWICISLFLRFKKFRIENELGYNSTYSINWDLKEIVKKWKLHHCKNYQIYGIPVTGVLRYIVAYLNAGRIQTLYYYPCLGKWCIFSFHDKDFKYLAFY